MKEKIFSIAKKFFASELVSGSMYLFVGTTIGNVLAFFFNLFLVRNLSYANYAEFAALSSLITLSAIPAQAILPTIVQFSSRYFAKDENDRASELFWQSNWKVGIIAGILFLIFLIFAPMLGNFLHIKNSFEIVLVGGIVAVIYIGITNIAFLQSLLHFQFLALTTVFGGILKLLIGIGAILGGFGLVGVMWGYFLTFFLPFLATFLPLRMLFSHRFKKRVTIHNKEIISYALPSAVSIFALSSFTSTDILLVKHFFPPSEAALYSGLSLIGRIIFYFTLPIPVVMFPLIVKKFHKGENFHNLLYTSFLLVLAPSLGITSFYFFFPKIAINIVLGSKYLSIVPYLGWFGIYLCVFSLINVMVNFFLSLKKTQVSWFIALGAITQAVGIWLLHSEIFIIIALSLVISLVLFVGLLLYYINQYVTKK